MAPTSSQQIVAARKWPNTSPLLTDAIEKMMCHDDALQLCFVALNNLSNQSEGNNGTLNEPAPSCVSTECGAMPQSPNENSLLQRMQPQTESFQHELFTFDLPDKQQPLFLTADVADELGVNQIISYNAMEILLDDNFALVASEVCVPVTCHVGALPAETTQHLKQNVKCHCVGEHTLALPADCHGCDRNGKEACCILKGPGEARIDDCNMCHSLLNDRIWSGRHSMENKKNKLVFGCCTQNFSAKEPKKADVSSIGEQRPGKFGRRLANPKSVAKLTKAGKTCFVKTCESMVAALDELEKDLHSNTHPSRHKIALQMCLGGSKDDLHSKVQFLS